MNNPSPMTLHCRRVGHYALNTHVLICPQSGKSVLIDPGAQPEVLVEMLAGSTPVAILITHGHPDHIGALDEMRRRLQVPVMAHRNSALGSNPIQADRLLEDHARIAVGAHFLAVRHTPGHTAEQVCFQIEADHRIIVGDTIFKGGPGKTWSARDFQTTLTTLRDVVLTWPDETHCYPGHGLSFNLGEQRAAIEAFIKEAPGDFFGDATWDMVDIQ
jgi:glyoxylase-like metal-dependent hydrolase (beta-lactamase superfamily II)